jgi:putative flippase GtrA
VKNFLLQNRQFLLYCFIGASCTCLDFGTYSVLLITGILNYQPANLIGYASGTLCSFFLNAHFNFRVKDRIGARMASFLIVGLIGYLVSAGLLHVLVEHYKCNEYLSKAATLVVVVLIQYNLNKIFSFRKAK